MAWIQCDRCGGKTYDLDKHRDGPSRSCDQRMGAKAAAKEQFQAARRGYTPAAPHVVLIRNLKLEVIPVPAQYVLAPEWVKPSVQRRWKEQGTPPVIIDGEAFRPIFSFWARKWVVNIAKLKMLLPARRRLIHILNDNEEAWFDYHDLEFQAAMGAAHRLGGRKGREDMIAKQLWWRRNQRSADREILDLG